VICAPPVCNMPIITSLSTRFLGQPRLTKPTFKGLGREAESGCGGAIVRFSTGMLSLYCSIGKASVFAELGSSVHVVGREDIAANGREKRKLVLIAFLCINARGFVQKSKSHHGCTRITRIYKLKNPNRTFVIRANQQLSVLSVVRVGFLYKANARYQCLSLKVIVAKWISRYARDENYWLSTILPSGVRSTMGA
jgi:hypothetical protein